MAFRCIVSCAELPYHVIQRHILLNDLSGLSGVINKRAGVNPPLLRLIAHFVLVHRSLGVAGDKLAEDAILRRAMLERMIHGCEYGAYRIYAGQLVMLKDKEVVPLIQHMWDQEKHHLATFEKLMPEKRQV